MNRRGLLLGAAAAPTLVALTNANAAGSLKDRARYYEAAVNAGYPSVGEVRWLEDLTQEMRADLSARRAQVERVVHDALTRRKRQ